MGTYVGTGPGADVDDGPGGGLDDSLDSLILDLLEWIGPGSRPYDEVMDAWRTSCPRLPVWEEAGTRGYVARGTDPGRGRLVTVTPAGDTFLHLRRGGPLPS
jgi:D-3-phosphoglycerate dehydrogenase / 2-oxoglutarate reductase